MRARWRWGTGHAGAGSLASPGSRGRMDAPKPEGSGWRSLSVRERGGARALALPVPDDPGGETERGDRPPCVLDARGGREDGKRGVGPRLGDVPGGLGAAQPASDVSGDVPEGAGTSSGVGRVLRSRGCRGARLGDMVPVFGGGPKGVRSHGHMCSVGGGINHTSGSDDCKQTRQTCMQRELAYVHPRLAHSAQHTWDGTARACGTMLLPQNAIGAFLFIRGHRRDCGERVSDLLRNRYGNGPL